jgi:hypothetical protein
MPYRSWRQLIPRLLPSRPNADDGRVGPQSDINRRVTVPRWPHLRESCEANIITSTSIC